jgi:hypothetical protein
MKMSRYLVIVLWIISIDLHSQIRNGRYEGLEETGIIDQVGEWYRLNSLSIRNDSVYISNRPICFRQNDTIFSVADYGFYSYAGLVTKKGQSNYISIFMTDCDYCITKIYVNSLKTTSKNHNDTLTYKVKMGKDYLKFNHVKYRYLPVESYRIDKMNFKDLFLKKELKFVEPEKIEIIEN